MIDTCVVIMRTSHQHIKAGSFDAVTHERFLMMSAIHGGVKGAPDLYLGESKEFPPLKILSAKTVGTNVSKYNNINVDVDEPAEPVTNKDAPKRRPAPAVGELVAKKKRTTVGRASFADKDLTMVAVVQDPESISIIPATTPTAQRRRAPKRKLVSQKGSDDEIFDSIIHHVIADTSAIETGEPDLGETDLEEPVIKETATTAEEGTDVREPDVVEPDAITAIRRDPLALPSGPITRGSSKKFKEALHGLVLSTQ
ncbi:hypothetical protein F511_15773 [Dorcoceras hygrometricum]|nr:hypothetical protein F511_15773 [Dorcoceras hygrometricum]